MLAEQKSLACFVPTLGKAVEEQNCGAVFLTSGPHVELNTLRHLNKFLEK